MEVNAATDERRVDAPSGDRAAGDRKPSADIFYPPVACAANLQLCDDFESPTLDPTKWTPWAWTYYFNGPRDVSIDLDSGPMVRGKHSVRFRQTRITGGEDNAESRDGWIRSVPMPLGTGDLFVRFMVFVDDPTPNRWFPMFFASDPDKARQDEYVYGLNLVPQSETMPYPSLFESSDQSYSHQYAPLGRWACWEVEIRGTDRKALFTLDGKEIPFYRNGLKVGGDGRAALVYAPARVQLNLGYVNGHHDSLQHPPDGFFDIWFDDIAVGNQRIGCPQ